MIIKVIVINHCHNLITIRFKCLSNLIDFVSIAQYVLVIVKNKIELGIKRNI
jgi:hypothetical protein